MNAATPRRLARRARASGKWFVFAVRADDRRRAAYSHLIGRFKSSDIRSRRDAVRSLPPPAVEIAPDVGFAIFPPGALEGVPAVVEEVQRIRQGLALTGDGAERPYLLDHAIVEPPPALLQFALDERVLSPISHYLGIVPMLTGITLLASPHVPGAVSGSQLLHSDWEDVRQVKIFVNCSAVAARNGPLTAVTADASKRVKRALGYHYGGPSFRLTDEQVRPLITDAETAAFTGAAGTTVFIDTSSCLHLGSRVEPGAEERLVVQFQYLTPSAFDLFLESRRRHPFASAAQARSTIEGLVLGCQ